MSASLASAEAGALTSLAAIAATATQNQTITKSSSPTSTTEYFPLTTLFTPPKWCTNMPMTFFGDNSGLTSTFWKDTAFPANDSLRVSMRSCYPPNFEYQPDLFATDGYVYSPGVCPSGYYAAKSNGIVGTQTGARTSWCCPTSMTFTAFQGCVSLTTPTTTATLYQLGSSILMNNPYYVLEPYIPVAWASSDLAEFTPTSAPLSNSAQCIRAGKSNAVASGVLVSGSGAAASSTPGIPGDKARGGLSTGAKAGIGVGVAAAAIAVIAMILLLLKYRRKAQVSAAELKKRDQTDTVELKNGIVVADSDADSRAEADFENYRAEADSSSSVRRNELDENVVRAEAEGSSLRHELDSGWYGHEKDTSYK